MDLDVGDRLRKARERIGMTQLELAEKVGVRVATATLWENRRHRRPVASKHLHKLAEVLGIRVSELLGEETTEPPPIPKSLPTLTTRTAQEYQLLWLFRRMPEELQLVQVAQFMECISIGQGGQPTSHEVSIDSAARESTVMGFGR